MPIENATRGHVMIDLDRPRILVFNFNAFAALRDKFGSQYLTSLIEKQSDNKVRCKSLQVLRAFVWAGLLDDADQHGEFITELQVGRMMKPAHTAEYFRAVLEAINAQIEAARGNAEQVEEKGADSTSKLRRVSRSVV